MLSPLTGELKSCQIYLGFFGHRLKTLAALAFVTVIPGLQFEAQNDIFINVKTTDIIFLILRRVKFKGIKAIQTDSLPK